MKKFVWILVLALSLFSCRKDEPIGPSPVDPDTPTDLTPVMRSGGFYLLNEANMGSNKSTLDEFLYDPAEKYAETYLHLPNYDKASDQSPFKHIANIYLDRNPAAVGGLGDVGNDLQIFGDYLYAVINASNLIEVMDVKKATHVASIQVSNVRYVTQANGKIYASSYAGPISLGNTQAGEIVEIDPQTWTITRKATVGRQPEELVVYGNKIYVANSGGYTPLDYETTVSVVDLKTFKEEKRIEVAPNLHRLRLAVNGKMYVSSRGDYYGTPSQLYQLDPVTEKVDSIGRGCTNLYIDGTVAYIFSQPMTNTSSGAPSYYTMDVNTGQILSENFITDGTEKQIHMPYGIAVHPYTHEILVTDAKNYMEPGELFVYSPSGVLQNRFVTGDIPSNIAFYY